MKKSILIALSCILISSYSFSQTKKDTVLTIIVSKENASKFLTILQVGVSSLMNTAIPANQVSEMNTYGTALFQKQLAIYQSWFPKPEPPKKDSVNKKPN